MIWIWNDNANNKMVVEEKRRIQGKQGKQENLGEQEKLAVTENNS
jgi:hypothetical protein